MPVRSSLMPTGSRSVRWRMSMGEDGQSLVEMAAPLVEGFDSLREMFADIAIAQGDEPLPQFHVWPLASYPVQLICPHNHTLAVAP